MIVGSILLAFAIDAGWDRYQDRVSEAKLLDRLAIELDGFESRGPPADQRSAATIRAINVLAAHAHSARDVPLDSLEWALTAVGESWQVAATSPTFDLLTSDGGYARVGDASLSDALARMSVMLELIRRFEGLSDEFVANHLNPWLNKNVDLWGAEVRQGRSWGGQVPSYFQLDPSALRSQEFSNLLLERRNRLELVVIFRAQFQEAVANAKRALNNLQY